MKNKKSLLGLGLLALVLVLGVGYAVVSQVSLIIGGTATVASSNLKVYFINPTTTGGAGTTVAAVENDLKATISVTGLTEVGQVATATYTIENSEKDLKAKITSGTITNNKTDYFEVTTDLGSGKTITENGGTTTVTVSVKLIKMPIDAEDSTAEIGVQLLATPVEK